MPELPEVETTRRGLLAAIKNAKITGCEVRRFDLRQPIPQNLAKKLVGRRILDVRRRAKYLLIDLDSGESILAHLGMSGSFIVMKEAGYALKTHDHLLISLSSGLLMVFNDPRRFGVVDIVRTAQSERHPLLKSLGPEPLSEDFSPDYLRTQLLRRKGAIKPVLMDQKLVVGVGNIYASESLYLSGINPLLSAAEITSKAEALIAAIRTTLEAAIASGGSTLRNYVGATNEGGYFQHHFNVYDRANEPCFSCGKKIQSCVQAGRATYWCEFCQSSAKNTQKRS